MDLLRLQSLNREMKISKDILGLFKLLAKRSRLCIAVCVVPMNTSSRDKGIRLFTSRMTPSTSSYFYSVSHFEV